MATGKEVDPLVRNEAVAVIASLKNAAGAGDLLGAWKDLTPSLRRTALDRLSRSKQGAQALVAPIKDGRISKDDLDGAVVERMQTHLVGRADLEDLMKELADFFRPVLGFNGDEEAWGELGLSLDGAFTVETWIRLQPGITNQDGILGAPGQIDVNFFDAKVRVYLFPPLNDVVVAKKPMSPDLWTHLAVVRDENAIYHLYQNGELDSSAAKPNPNPLKNLRLAWTSSAGGLDGALNEYRVWNRARSASEIRANFDRSFAGQPKPEGLLFLGSGAEGWGNLKKGAMVTRTNDLPPLMTPEQSRALEEKFAKYEALGRKAGDPAKGKVTAALCTACHLIGGQGGNIGPNLSGVGAMGLEAILRNILTPNAAMEPGYRIFRAELKNGEIREGFLASEDKEAVVVRLPGANDLRIARADIVRSSFLRRSLMPEGLLDALPPEQVTDLLAYLQSLK
jgi:putative heme-binding domain-containing protein